MRGRRDELIAALGNFRYSAWGWECQGIYAEPEHLLAQWRVGRIDEDVMLRWLASDHAITSSGRSLGRVWVLSDPVTEYERWRLDMVDYYRDAGNRVQTLSEAEALRLDLPDHDFWIFDNELVATLHFEDHVMCGADLITDPRHVRRYRGHRDAAISAAREVNVSQQSR